MKEKVCGKRNLLQYGFTSLTCQKTSGFVKDHKFIKSRFAHAIIGLGTEESMPNSSQILLWTQPDWLRLAHAWIYQSLRNQGKPVIGPVEQIHVRPWSTILRAPITGGYVFFKASILSWRVNRL